jgi:hypothetical protein
MTDQAGWQWEDARRVAYRERLSWGWSPVDAAFSAYYGKPLRAVLVLARARTRAPERGRRAGT